MSRRNSSLVFVGGLLAGARLMYMLDPDRGRRRRAQARDRFIGLAHEVQRGLDRGIRDLVNRAQGLMLDFFSDAVPLTISDEVLTDRVRARMGRIVSHPGSIEVVVINGAVFLHGLILQTEVAPLLRAIRHMPGVLSIDNRLAAYKEPGDVAGLQGARSPRLSQFELLRPRWAPATRLVGGVAGSALALWGIKRRDPLGATLGLIGAGIILRSATNRCPAEFVGLRQLDGITLQKTVTINAPVERVFDLLADPEKFPRLMSHIQNVEKLGDGNYRWTVAGPAGTMLSWESGIVRLVPNRLLVWNSAPKARLKNSGLVQFDSIGVAATRVHVRMSYFPPAGMLGHEFARLFGVDPKRALDEDLARLKSLLERGKTSAHHEQVTLEEVIGT